MPTPKPPFPWMGSKRRLARQILPHLPRHTCYVEPFAGSAAVLFARPDPPKVEVLNDLDRDIVNLFRVLKHHLSEFVAQFRWALTSRTLFEWARSTEPETLTDIQRAARFYYLQKLCFGGRPTSRSFGIGTTHNPSLNLLRIEEELSAVHLRLARVVIEELPWQECVRRYDRPHTLLFCDPPYLDTAGYESGAWTVERYEELAGTLGSLRGKALVTLNDHPEVRRIFSSYRHHELQVRYSIGTGKSRSRVRNELLLFSWEEGKGG